MLVSPISWRLTRWYYGNHRQVNVTVNSWELAILGSERSETTTRWLRCSGQRRGNQLHDGKEFGPRNHLSSAPNSVRSVWYLYHGEERHVKEAKAWHAAEYLPELGAECSCTCHSTKSTIPCLALWSSFPVHMSGPPVTHLKKASNRQKKKKQTNKQKQNKSKHTQSRDFPRNCFKWPFYYRGLVLSIRVWDPNKFPLV